MIKTLCSSEKPWWHPAELVILAIPNKHVMIRGPVTPWLVSFDFWTQPRWLESVGWLLPRYTLLWGAVWETCLRDFRSCLDHTRLRMLLCSPFTAGNYLPFSEGVSKLRTSLGREPHSSLLIYKHLMKCHRVVQLPLSCVGNRIFLGLSWI